MVYFMFYLNNININLLLQLQKHGEIKTPSGKMAYRCECCCFQASKRFLFIYVNIVIDLKKN